MTTLYVAHGGIRAGRLLQQVLQSSSSEHHATVLDFDDVAEKRVALALEQVGGEDTVHLIHVAEPSDTTVAEVGDCRTAIEEWFPGLDNLIQWLVVDIGRSWDQSERDILESLLLSDRPVAGVLAVSGSTSVTVTADVGDDDLTAMMVDAAWSLGVGGGASLLLDGVANIWGVGTASFTLDDTQMLAPSINQAIETELSDGPLAPYDVRSDDGSAGAQWVTDQGLDGLDLLTHPSLVSVEDVRLKRGTVQELVVEDWPRASVQQYRRMSGVPLARIRREIEANASQILDGRKGERRQSGLVAALDSAVDARLRETAGVRRAAAFLVGVAEVLDDELRTVRAQSRKGKSTMEIDEESAELARSVQQLPSPMGWAARGGVAGTAAAVGLASLAASVPGVGVAVALAVVGPGLVGLTGLWGLSQRRAIVTKLTGLLDSADEVLSDRVRQLEIVERTRILEQLRNHVGSFLDEDYEVTTDIDAAVAVESEGFQVGTLCSALVRLRDDLVELRDQSEQPSGEAAGSQTSLHSLGQFFRVFPDSGVPEEMDILRKHIDPELQAGLGHCVGSVLAGLSLAYTGQLLREAIRQGIADMVASQVRSLGEVAGESSLLPTSMKSALSVHNRSVHDWEGLPLSGGVKDHLFVFVPEGPSVSGYLPEALSEGKTHTTVEAGRVVAVWATPLKNVNPPVPVHSDVNQAGQGSGSDERDQGVTVVVRDFL